MKILHIVPGLDDPTNGIVVAAKMIARSPSGEKPRTCRRIKTFMGRHYVDVVK